MKSNNRREFIKNSSLLLGGLLLNSSKIFSREDAALFSTKPFLGEIAIFSFNFAPKNWAQCNGQLLPINQNQALFSLLGTTFGGDGQVDFALPDLRGRVPIHVGNGHILGQRSGEQAHTLHMHEMPMHKHAGKVSVVQKIGGNADQESPVGALPGKNDNHANRFSASYDEMMELAIPAAGNEGTVGGSQAHQNMQPFLTLNFCIALVGIFPTRN
ncbi:phage tail protein [Sphingobacterium wenxiniae]|uniref:Microcystin-dependent protein n=1 Tax=Sphingobacterium wenxiniae TaxID=683125 RepID=A0A1I6Q1P2_9SPHI|nr:tail fiber protein [Sphingobacterium wenxiniae]SFS46411.1 Microcystin-dependent protein [Sphingobacterium wenxiniae]